MIRANNFRRTIHMRVMAGLADAGGDRVERGPVSLFVWGAPKEPHSFLKTGLRAGTSTWVRTSDNALPARVKCNANYVNGRLAEMEALTNGYDRAVILNGRGKVSESPGATLFTVKDGVPITPGVTSEVLESITRDTLIRLLGEKIGLATLERDLDRTEIYAAEECFLCGTLAEVTPIVSLDGIQIGDGTVGPVTRALQEHYLDQVHGRTQDHTEWLTPVYQTARRSAA
jgi:branched-chain amino acid aminotransferase